MSIKKKYHGLIVPVITPITRDYKLDHEAVDKIFSHLYNNNASPFFLGTTGEAASLPASVKIDYLKQAIKNKRPGTLLYAGISSNCLEESIDFAKRCLDAGIDAVAATLSSYYTLSESQMRRYFEQLADEIKGPLIIYNIPATTNMSIPVSLIDELSYHENIVAVKDSERCEDRLQASLKLWSKREDFSHFLGWAAKSAYALINGSDGLIPSTGNLHPELYADLMEAVRNGDYDKAYQYQEQSDKLGNLYQGQKSLGESLWALKVLMQDFGLCQSNVMPPLHALSPEEEVRLRTTLQKLLLNEGIKINLPLSHV
ncbi:dihydrodipicolinate synthase family protein [Paradesertivirga mongoliensis]|uniref:Dihydrodipicolinate synthase family protein n=1 Tax=Paradesertivirga mongoliensis TaxID=2100740 RepID=A0ABW4ZQT6_9SPHI|nr:dihydrodipicolinate synthase family protein [Pedobacter mongoliensis]